MNIENLFDYESLRYEKKYICSNLLTSQARLIIKSLPAPFFRKTAIGAKKMERRISTSLLSMMVYFP